MRLIDADKLNFEKLQDTNNKAVPALEYVAFLKGVIAAQEIIENAPTIDAEPVVHARWLTDEDDDVYCSHCQCNALFNNVQVNNEPYDYVESPRCPNCGAKMDEEDW